MSQEILDQAQSYLKEHVFSTHGGKNLDKASRLSSYKLNPFLTRYLANFAFGDASAENVAKALLYPRMLGTSISTSFGSGVQKMVTSIIPGAVGSMVDYMDIEFDDQIDGRRKYCQLKAGPNTINSGDVQPMIEKFTKALQRGRGNFRDLKSTDLIVGVLYGERTELSQHYGVINEQYPVFIGTEFWERLTGSDQFYSELIGVIAELAESYNSSGAISNALANLASEIRDSGVLDA